MAVVALAPPDLAGRAVGLSRDIPAVFDAPLARHHTLIGRWATARETSARRFTRPEARRSIEHAFDAAVLALLRRVELVDLRVVILLGSDDLPPAIAIICDSMGQIDLGWIEKSNLLSDSLSGRVAPVGWRAAAYKALVDTLVGPLPIFGYEALFEEVSAYYWDGATDDAGAREHMIDSMGAALDGSDGEILPSAMNARRPDFMLAEKAARLKDMPAGLQRKLRALRDAGRAMRACLRAAEGSAWRFAFDEIIEYLPDFEDRSSLPPLTLVPFDIFARELDDVSQHGMQTGFMDIAGLCRLTDSGRIDDWLASLQVGVNVLLAAQDLIDFDPAHQ